jgi:rhamnosyltransferase
MRILAYVGTYNEPVDRPLEALARQTRAPDGIVVVDNASTSPPTSLPPGVDRVRTDRNLGPGSAVSRGLQHAMDLGYEWMWIFDADSAPRPDALAKLVGLYQRLPASERAAVGVISCTAALDPSGQHLLARRFTAGGPRNARVVQGADHYECDATIWSGSLYRVSAAKQVGMPRVGATVWDDLGHDYGDFEYSNRIRRAGYRLLVSRDSILDQHVGDALVMSVFGREMLATNHPPERRYLFFRNMAFFWMHIYPHSRVVPLLSWYLARLAVTIAKITWVEEDKAAKIRACLRGAWAGARGRVIGVPEPL